LLDSLLQENMKSLVVKPKKMSQVLSHFGPRGLSTSSTVLADQHFRLVVVGGGSGGCATVNKFARKLGKGKVALIEPSEDHYYQPMWTLVGGGTKTLQQSVRPQSSLLPKSVSWFRERVTTFQPDENCLITQSGEKINYDYLVIAVGIQLRYEKTKGLVEALETPGVCSNYSPLHVEKNYQGN